MPEKWNVELRVDGRFEVRDVIIRPPFCIKCADAEVQAIRAAEAEGGKAVQALRSYFVSEVSHAV
jgi:hypothetical protein